MEQLKPWFTKLRTILIYWHLKPINDEDKI